MQQYGEMWQGAAPYNVYNARTSLNNDKKSAALAKLGTALLIIANISSVKKDLSIFPPLVENGNFSFPADK